MMKVDKLSDVTFSVIKGLKALNLLTRIILIKQKLYLHT